MGAEQSTPTESTDPAPAAVPPPHAAMASHRQADAAAHRIQTLWRCYLLRMDALDEAEELRQRRAVYQLLARVEEAAAVKIQSAARRRSDHSKQSSAAVLLQAAMRGASTRRAELLRQREIESRVAVMIASGPHRFAMKIQGCVRQWLAWRAEEAAEAERKALEAAERSKSQEIFRRKREERKAKDEEQRLLKERKAEADRVRRQYHQRTLMALPVRKRSRRWPHGWEARELTLDEGRQRLVWQRPDSLAMTSARQSSLDLDDILSVSLLDAQLGTFAVAVPSRFYEFRAPCTEALEAWSTRATPTRHTPRLRPRLPPARVPAAPFWPLTPTHRTKGSFSVHACPLPPRHVALHSEYAGAARG
jgi:hypothetical protein